MTTQRVEDARRFLSLPRGSRSGGELPRGRCPRAPRAPHWGTSALRPELNLRAGIVALLWKLGIDDP